MKTALFSTVAALACLTLAGCGGGGSSSAPTAPVAVPPPTPPPVVSAPAQPGQPGSILLNQHGFASHARLRAVLVDASAAGKAFELRNDRDQIILTGQTAPFGADPASGLSIHKIDGDLTGITGTGFTVRVGTQDSDPFDVGGSLYADLSRDSLSYFYQSRVGKPVEASYVPTRFPALTRPAGHVTQVLSCFAGTDRRGTVWPGCDAPVTIESGWYDAGDYGQYASSTGFSTWVLLNMGERQNVTTPNQCPASLGDGALQMPEAGNGVSDILDEARLGVENLLSMQTLATALQPMARGTQAATGPLTLTPTVPTGMVHHKIHGLAFPGDDVAAHEDVSERFIYPPTTSATLHLAAVGAQCARVFRTVDPDFSTRCLTASRAAYAAAVRVPDAFAWDEFEGGGPYADRDLADEFGWAATELWLTTGETRFATDLATHTPQYNPFGSFDWSSVQALGLLSIMTRKEDVAAEPRLAAARTALLTWADRFEGQSATSGFMIPKDEATYSWGSNGNYMNHAMLMAAAYTETQTQKYRRGVNDTMDYLMGRNALGQSYITGYGERPFKNPHHRYWKGGINPSRPFPPPGVMSGGPNNTSMIDPVAAALQGNCVGMACWVDDYDAYSLNEVSIVWNASFASVAHWLHSQDTVCLFGG